MDRAAGANRAAGRKRSRPHTSRWTPANKKRLATTANGRAACAMCAELCPTSQMEGNHKIPFSLDPTPNRKPNQLLCKDCHWLKTEVCEWAFSRGQGPTRESKISPRSFKQRLFELMSLRAASEEHLLSLLQPEIGISIPEMIERGDWDPNKYAEQRKLANLLPKYYRSIPKGYVHPIRQPQRLPVPTMNDTMNFYRQVLTGPHAPLQKIQTTPVVRSTRGAGLANLGPRGARFYPHYGNPTQSPRTFYKPPGSSTVTLYLHQTPVATLSFDGKKGNIQRIELDGNQADVYFSRPRPSAK